MSASWVLNYTKRCSWFVGVTAPANTLLPGYTLRHFHASVEIKSLHVGLSRPPKASSPLDVADRPPYDGALEASSPFHATVPSYFMNVALNSFVELPRNSTCKVLPSLCSLGTAMYPAILRKQPFAYRFHRLVSDNHASKTFTGSHPGRFLVIKRCRRGSLMRCCPTGSVENNIPANTGHMADAALRHLITDSYSNDRKPGRQRGECGYLPLTIWS